MIREGDEAPTFSLPGVEGGAVDTVALEDYLGDDIIILAFYPADFNPACDGDTTDLDELDLFTMQKDVSIVGISGDSVYSHRKFADTYDLHIPLLADVDGRVAADYGVAVDDPTAGYQTNRAVVVIDPGGEVQYAWQTEKLTRLPPVDRVRRAVKSIGGGDAAMARYRVGHAHYVEGRRGFTSAMGEFKKLEWMMAQGDFGRARDEFDEAADQFNTAVRFAVSDEARTYFERAEKKADALSQAAEWLEEAASAYASGEGAEADDLRSDAERPLETARDIHEPPSPDDFPPEKDPAGEDEDEAESILPTEDDESSPTLDAEITAGDDSTPTDGERPQAEPAAAGGEPSSADDEQEETATPANPAEPGEEADDGDEQIDDEELEEIAAELEEQNKQVEAERAAEEAAADAERVADEDDGTAAASVDDDLNDDGTLNLADPTEGEDDDDEEQDEEDEDEEEPTATGDDNLGGGNHGVPDSL